MLRSSVTVSLVPEVRGGPFVLWDDLGATARLARSLGFDGIEVFAGSAAEIPESVIRTALSETGLALSAMGTGAGWVKHKLSLTSPEPSTRQKAREFIRAFIDRAGAFQAPAIIGSMQGRFGDGVSRETALAHLRDALADLGPYAQQFGVPILYESLNRYETNLIVHLEEAAAFIKGLPNVKLLADLFHMNIEESDLAAAIRSTGHSIGHVHLADSNRRPAGCGHTDFSRIFAALRDVNYDGYVSAEAFPWPDPEAAARQTILAFRQYSA